MELLTESVLSKMARRALAPTPTPTRTWEISTAITTTTTTKMIRDTNLSAVPMTTQGICTMVDVVPAIDMGTSMDAKSKIALSPDQDITHLSIVNTMFAPTIVMIVVPTTDVQLPLQLQG